MKHVEKGYCDICDSKVKYIYEEVNRDYNVKGEIINVDILTSKCSVCNEEIWDDDLIRENEKIIFSKYRKIKGLLFPEEIKEIRKRYGLTQKVLKLKYLKLNEKCLLINTKRKSFVQNLLESLRNGFME